MDPFSPGRWPDGWDIMTDDKLNWPIKEGQEGKSFEERDFEVERIKTLLKEGDFLPGCDHIIPPDVPYENMVYFMNEVQKLSDYEETRITISQ